MIEATPNNIEFDTEKKEYVCHGEWTISNLDQLLAHFEQIITPKTTQKSMVINGQQIKAFDSAGALAIIRCMNTLAQSTSKKISLVGFTPRQESLIKLVEQQETSLDYKTPVEKAKNVFYYIGQEAINKVSQVDGIIILIGDLSIKIFEAARSLKRFHYPSTTYRSAIIFPHWCCIGLPNGPTTTNLWRQHLYRVSIRVSYF